MRRGGTTATSYSMENLAEARVRVVRDHMALECEHDWDGVIATFAHPRYEMYGTGATFDGEAAVRGYFAASRVPFADQANEIIAIATDADTVLVEFWLTGTHLGRVRIGARTIPASRPPVSSPHGGDFEFAGDSDRIVCEQPYYDQGAVLRALGV